MEGLVIYRTYNVHRIRGGSFHVLWESALRRKVKKIKKERTDNAEKNVHNLQLTRPCSQGTNITIDASLSSIKTRRQCNQETYSNLREEIAEEANLVDIVMSSSISIHAKMHIYYFDYLHSQNNALKADASRCLGNYKLF